MMDGKRLDTLARLLAAGLPRRRLLGGVTAGLLGVSFGHRPRRGAAACNTIGRPCHQNDDCCAGETCRNGVCDAPPICRAGADACADDRPVYCGLNRNCVCVQSTEGQALCGDLETNSGFCGVCSSSADCAPLGKGAFCARAKSSSSCCALGVGDNTCMLPCRA
jgi:hypothetical protein